MCRDSKKKASMGGELAIFCAARMFAVASTYLYAHTHVLVYLLLIAG